MREKFNGYAGTKATRQRSSGIPRRRLVAHGRAPRCSPFRRAHPAPAPCGRAFSLRLARSRSEPRVASSRHLVQRLWPFSGPLRVAVYTVVCGSFAVWTQVLPDPNCTSRLFQDVECRFLPLVDKKSTHFGPLRAENHIVWSPAETSRCKRSRVRQGPDLPAEPLQGRANNRKGLEHPALGDLLVGPNLRLFIIFLRRPNGPSS